MWLQFTRIKVAQLWSNLELNVFHLWLPNMWLTLLCCWNMLMMQADKLLLRRHASLAVNEIIYWHHPGGAANLRHCWRWWDLPL